jgi:hypothetical protein
VVRRAEDHPGVGRAQTGVRERVGHRLVAVHVREQEGPLARAALTHGPGRGVDCPHPAVRAPPGPLRDEQMPMDRHLAPRDATERRLIRHSVLQGRATCFQACREARPSEPERESEGPETVTKLRHGHHPRTWPDQREAKETGPSLCKRCGVRTSYRPTPAGYSVVVPGQGATRTRRRALSSAAFVLPSGMISSSGVLDVRPRRDSREWIWRSGSPAP